MAAPSHLDALALVDRFIAGVPPERIAVKIVIACEDAGCVATVTGPTGAHHQLAITPEAFDVIGSALAAVVPHRG